MGTFTCWTNIARVNVSPPYSRLLLKGLYQCPKYFSLTQVKSDSLLLPVVNLVQLGPLTMSRFALITLPYSLCSYNHSPLAT